MRTYKYIPFPELRRKYERRRRLRKALAELVIKIFISAACGVMMGLMLTGMWIEF